MSVLPSILGGLALACVGGAALADVRHFEIPDGWSIATAGLFAVFAIVALPPSAWWEHGAVGAALYLGGALLFSRGWLGGGDVKLLAACGLWAGFDLLPQLLVGMAASGGLLALVAIVARRLVGPGHPYPGLRYDGPLPYATAILGGALAVAGAAI